MSDRAYVLLHSVSGHSEGLADALRPRQGVLMADVLEGPPDVIVVFEAPNRRELARLTVQALASVEDMTQDVTLLPSLDKQVPVCASR